MRKILKLLGDYWYVPLFILAVIFGWVLFRRHGTPIEQTRAELDAIKAGRDAQELQARLGAEGAKRILQIQYSKELTALNEEQKTKAKELQNDPKALAKFLVRAGSTQ